MDGRLLSFWDTMFSGAFAVGFREGSSPPLKVDMLNLAECVEIVKHTIFTYIYHKFKSNVGKYTSPKDPGTESFF